MPRNDHLWQRLKGSPLSSLQEIAGYLRIREREEKSHDALVEEISRELRYAASHLFMVPFRGTHDFPYKKILIDVANKLAPGFTFLSYTPYKLSDKHSEEEIEDQIWEFYESRLQAKLASMPTAEKQQLKEKVEEELKRSGYNQTLATHVGLSLFCSGAGAAIGPGLAYGLALNTASGFAYLKLLWLGQASTAAVLGAGALITMGLFAPLFAFLLGSTNYSKTIPTVIDLIRLRKTSELIKEYPAPSSTVFISHSIKDKGFIEAEVLNPLRRANIATWYAPNELIPGHPFQAKIIEGLQASNYFMVIMSPNAATSEWVPPEVHMAFQRKKVVVPVMYKLIDRELIHPLLLPLQYMDFSVDVTVGRLQLSTFIKRTQQT